MYWNDLIFPEVITAVEEELELKKEALVDMGSIDEVDIETEFSWDQLSIDDNDDKVEVYWVGNTLLQLLHSPTFIYTRKKCQESFKTIQPSI